MSFKVKALAVLAGGVVVVLMIGTAPWVLKAFGTPGDPGPKVQVVCKHLEGDLGLRLADCPAMLAQAADFMGKLYPAHKRCLLAATTMKDVRLCNNPAWLQARWRKPRR